VRNTLPVPSPSSHPVDVGHRSETAILAAFVERGFEVLLPWGINRRYDMVLDLGDRFARVQCKTGRLKNGAVEFSARSIRSNTITTLARNYVGEVDFFAVYCPANRAVYVVPCDDTTLNNVYLRVEPTTNNQSKRIRWAASYELARFEP
jgi:hypothetical protein